MCLGFTSFTMPATPYRYDIAKGTLTPFEEPGARTIDPAQYDVSQAFFPSKDGTRISVFLVHKQGLAKDGQRPVLLTGYGGFNVSVQAAFDASDFVWLGGGGDVGRGNLLVGGR